MPPQVRDLGIPVKAVSWTRLHPGQTIDGKASLLASMSQNNGGFFVVDIDIETGHCTQFHTEHPKQSTFSPGAFRSLTTGILYVCSAWDGHLHRFDANHPERGIEDLGSVDDDATFGNGIAETPDGMIWIGSCPGAFLTKYDPTTGEMTKFGRIVNDDNYLYPVAGIDGSLAAQIKATHQRVIVIDPATGAHRQIGPSITDTTDASQSLQLYRGTDDLLYLKSHEGTMRIEGMETVDVQNAPEPRTGIPATYKHDYQAPAEMPGGWNPMFTGIGINGTGEPRELHLANSNPEIAARDLKLDWVGGGNNIHVIALGPDGDLYGSSYLPNRLFHATPDGSVAEDLGIHSYAGGQAYSTANIDGKLYLASYPGSHISVYDPTKPIHYGEKPGDNPRDFGRFDKVSFRPNALISTPDGKLWMGSAPDYGLHEGTLVWMNPQTGESQSHRALLPDTSPVSLLHLPKLNQILIGLSIEAGTGSKVRHLDASFALWDPIKDEMVWSGNLGIEDLADPVALAPTTDGLVYALLGFGDQIQSQGAPAVRPRLILFDPAKRELIAQAWLPEEYGPLGWQGHHALQVGPQGVVYGASGYCIFRIKPGTCDVERVWQNDEPPPPRKDPVWLTHSTPDAIDCVGPIIGDQFYFSTGWRLRALTLPAEQ